MVKIYSNSLIKGIQSVINTGKFEIKTYKDYSFFDCLNSIGIVIKPCDDPKTERRDCILNINNPDITSKYVSDWRSTAPGKFFIKDYKKDNKDFIGNTLYHEIQLIVNNVKLRILIRLLNEITDPDISEECKTNYISDYGDITIDGKYFSIIKITDDFRYFTWGINDKFRSIDTVIMSNDTEGISYIDNIDNDANKNEMSDDNISEPLF